MKGLIQRLKERFWPVRLSPWMSNYRAVQMQNEPVRLYRAMAMMSEYGLHQCVNDEQKEQYREHLVDDLVNGILKATARTEILRAASVHLDVQLEYSEGISPTTCHKELRLIAFVRDLGPGRRS